MRFTIDGSEALERRIASDMEAVRQAVRAAVGAEELAALVLGGGYGRGEGGVYTVDGEERVYNDYDFFVIVPFTSRKRRNALSAKLLEVKAAIEPRFGIHVDFSPPMPLSTLGALPYEVMYMEAREGHHVLIGPDDVFSALPAYDPARPPLEECARLFMNRGIGLFLAGKTISQRAPLDTEDHEFAVRNIYKAMMAMGDSVLYLRGDYSPSYVERRRRFAAQDLAGVSGGDRLSEVYEASLDFKLRPGHAIPGGASLEAWHRDMVGLYLQVFLWFERQRLNRPTLDWQDYVRLPARLPWKGPRETAKNIVRNLRHRAGQFPPIGEIALHPRDRVLRRLPGLLASDTSDPAAERLVILFWGQYG
jgi:hypothetical protein